MSKFDLYILRKDLIGSDLFDQFSENGIYGDTECACTLPCQKFRATPADQLVIHMKISFFRKPLLVVFTKLITKFFVQL